MLNWDLPAEILSKLRNICSENNFPINNYTDTQLCSMLATIVKFPGPLGTGEMLAFVRKYKPRPREAIMSKWLVVYQDDHGEYQVSESDTQEEALHDAQDLAIQSPSCTIQVAEQKFVVTATVVANVLSVS